MYRQPIYWQTCELSEYTTQCWLLSPLLPAVYRGANKSLARPERKQARKHVKDARDFNNIETRFFIKFFFLQEKAPKEIQAILTKTLAFLFS